MEIDNKEKTIAGLVGLVLILAGFGGNALFTEDEFDNAYVCPLTEEVGVFHRLSASGKTGYYFDTQGLELKVACRSGRVYEPWIKLNDYAKSKGVDPLSLIIQAKDEQYVPSGKGAKQWLCSVDGCVPKT